VAALMNGAFISVKVDREERPDLDHVYMTVCQMLTGSGGWPLTVLMTPEKKPFFTATYIPPRSRFGRAGMVELIPRIQDVWKNRREEVLDSSGRIVSALAAAALVEAESELDESTLERAFRELASSRDTRNGGFGKAPKFPSPHNLLFLLRYWKRTSDAEALEMAEDALQSMRLGGLFDHVGLGFHRYSTDEEWLVPHFEKMLYDQAMIALAFVEAWQATGNPLYRRTAEEVFDYVIRDMSAPGGGFCAAEDADSEGEEGRFYVWTEEQIREVLPKEEADLAVKAFGVTPGGNFRDEATGRRTGKNILHLKAGGANRFTDDPGEQARLEKIRSALYRARASRVRPLRDDKVLTDWNGLMIAALAKGGRAFSEPRYTGAAAGAAAFLEKRLAGDHGRLLHRFREGRAGIDGHLDDYAFLIWGLLELYEATFDDGYLGRALKLARVMKELFEDVEHGGFFFSAEGARDLIVRKKQIQDAALPSGNSVAAFILLRLAGLTGLSEFEASGGRVLQALGGAVEKYPSAFTFLLCALDFALGPATEVVIVGHRGGKVCEAMIEALGSRFLPGTVTLFRPAGPGRRDIDDIAPFVRGYEAVRGKATAYVCSGRSCRAPVTGLDKFLEAIETPDGGVEAG
jgi:uncharacterized protein